MGKVDCGRRSSGQGHAQFRRSLYFVKNMEADEVITEDCVRSVRPGFGLAPKYLNELLCKIVVREIGKNMPVTEGVVG